MDGASRCPSCNRYSNPFDILTIMPNLKCCIGRQSGVVISGVFYSFYALESEEDKCFRTRASLRCRSCGFEFDDVTEGPVALENMRVDT